MISTLMPRGRLWAACVPTKAPICPTYSPDQIVAWYKQFEADPASSQPPILLLNADVQIITSEQHVCTHLFHRSKQLCGLSVRDGLIMQGVDRLCGYRMLWRLCRRCWTCAIGNDLIAYLSI